MWISNEWFDANFPGTLEQQDSASVSEGIHVRTRTFISEVPGRLGVFAVKLSQLPVDLWPKMPTGKRVELAASLVGQFGDQILSDIARPRLFNRPKVTMDQIIPTTEGAATRRLAFQFKERGVPMACFVSLTCSSGVILQTIATSLREPDEVQHALSFMSTVQLKDWGDSDID